MKIQYKGYKDGSYHIVTPYGHSYLFLQSQEGVLEIKDKNDIDYLLSLKQFKKYEKKKKKE